MVVCWLQYRNPFPVTSMSAYSLRNLLMPIFEASLVDMPSHAHLNYKITMWALVSNIVRCQTVNDMENFSDSNHTIYTIL